MLKRLEPVFQRAQEAGIPVITHESPDQQGNTWDIEMIDNKQFGELYMKTWPSTWVRKASIWLS